MSVWPDVAHVLQLSPCTEPIDLAEPVTSGVNSGECAGVADEEAVVANFS